MTRPDIDGIAKRAEAATSGPWEIEREELDGAFDDEEAARAFPMTIGPIDRWEHVLDSRDESVVQIEADAAFIAAARADVPALLAYIRELEAERDRLRAATCFGSRGGDDGYP